MKKYLNSIHFKLTLFSMTVVFITVLIFSSAVIIRERSEFRKNAERTTEFFAQTIGERVLSLLLESQYQELGQIIRGILLSEPRIIAVRIIERTRLGDIDVLTVRGEDFAEYNFESEEGFSSEYYHYRHPLRLRDETRGQIQIFYSLNEMHENIRKFYIIVLVIVLISVVIGFLLTFFISKVIVRPIKSFTASAKKISSGNLNEQIQIKSKDEIGILAHSFEVMRQKIKQHIEELDSKVKERTQSITDLLDNAGQGFLSFSESLIIYPEYSKQCIEIFGFDIAGKNVLELLCKKEYDIKSKYKDVDVETNIKYKEAIKEIGSIKETLEFSFQSDNSEILKLLADEIDYLDKKLSVKFVYLHNTEIDEKKIMLIVTDITNAKMLEEKAKQEEARNKFIVKVALDKKSFISFINDVRTILENLRKEINSKEITHAKIEEIFRLIHTIKGNASFFNLSKVVDSAHKLEDYIYILKDNKMFGDKIDIDELNRLLDAIFIGMNESLDLIGDFLTKQEIFGQEKIYEIPETKIDNIINDMVAHNLTNEEKLHILKKVKELKKISIKYILKRFKQNAELLARRLNKKINPVELVNEDTPIDYYFLKPVVDNVVHLIRNAVDHGIEYKYEREKLGKPPVGNVSISIEETIQEDYTTVKLIVKDDGRGIDTDKLRNKLIKQGVLSETEALAKSEEEIMKYIFNDGISSKDTVNLLSGRGVGMSAMKNAVEKIGGKIIINSKINEGTEIVIKVSYKSI